MNRDAAFASPDRTLSRSLFYATMNSLTESDIQILVAACADRNHTAGRDLLAFTGAQSFSGVMARLALSTPREREQLLAIIRRIIKDHASAE